MGDIFGAGTIAAGIMGNVTNALLTTYNNQQAAKREETARAENYYYGEKAAQNADMRTRSLYNDLYSPVAQLEQLKNANLSPSLFYGDGGGISGQSGAQGTGAAGISPTSFGIPPFDLSGIALATAQVDKIRAETQNIKAETHSTDLQNELQELKNTEFKTEFTIVNSHFMQNGNETSVFEIADSANSYKQFLTNIREIANASTNIELRDATTTEKGQEILRNIYMQTRYMSKDIKVLSQQGTDADFYKSITLALKDENFAKLNAQEAIMKLRESIETSKLNETQQEAWNNMLDKMGNGTLKDIAIILGMILDRAASNYNMPNINYKSNNKMFVR